MDTIIIGEEEIGVSSKYSASKPIINSSLASTKDDCNFESNDNDNTETAENKENRFKTMTGQPSISNDWEFVMT